MRSNLLSCLGRDKAAPKKYRRGIQGSGIIRQSTGGCFIQKHPFLTVEEEITSN